MTSHHQFSISLSIIMIFFFLLLVDVRISFADDEEINMERLKSCRNDKFNCRDQQGIGYPFWGSNRPDYCGHPGYKLNCVNGLTQIESMSTKYRVLKIDEESKTMRIAISDFLDDACPSDFANVTRNFSLFSFPGVLDMDLFYGCPSEMAPFQNFPYTFKCQRNTTSTKDGAYFVPPTFQMRPQVLQILYSSCEVTVQIPIMESDWVRLMRNASTLGLVLREGFELNYSSSAAANFTFCDGCLNSGGQCGFNSTLYQHTCFCGNTTTSGQNFCGATAATPAATPATTRADMKKGANKIIIITTVLIGIPIIIVGTYFSWRWMAKHRDNPSSESLDPHMFRDNQDLKIFSFEELIIATNNFSELNKLGQGGFGSVYKGELPDGQVIAIKRLSKSSGQGLQEFKNEVVVISKLQHRNLVRLTGYCIAGKEKILIYEYMPNNSLDTYLFGSDPTKRGLLDWGKRFQIIEGISRGILYLHRDSRLKVIHRDLKPSNVLLDEELNPKISDFGMARIFGSNELQANTNRVVGTYGYMSPEYAMEGQFSEKSDVFSFGVLLLEIVSGRRNTSFYNHDQSLSLLKHAWLLWNVNEIQSLIEPALSRQPHFEREIVRCIHVGLLCVQEFANDRPTMLTTLSMLTSEIATLPTPKQPAFTQRLPSSHSSSHEHKTVSINTVTLTSVGGR